MGFHGQDPGTGLPQRLDKTEIDHSARLFVGHSHAFNDAVTEYNTYKQTFPPVIFAAMFGHANNASLLEFEDTVVIQQVPKVAF